MKRRRAASTFVDRVAQLSPAGDRHALGGGVDLLLRDLRGDDGSRERDLIGGGQQRMRADLVEVTPKQISLVTTCRNGACPCHPGRR